MENSPAAIISVLMETNDNALVKVVEDIFEWKEGAYSIIPSGELTVSSKDMTVVISLLNQLMEHCISHNIELKCFKDTYHDHCFPRNEVTISYKYYGEDTIRTLTCKMPSYHNATGFSLFNDYKFWLAMLFNKTSESNLLSSAVEIVNIFDDTERKQNIQVWYTEDGMVPVPIIIV